MKLTTAHWPLLAALGCLLLGGWVHGTWSGRWRPQDALVEALARVERVPMRVGNWQATALKTDETEFAQAHARSYWMRTYTHTRSKASLQVILMCGRAGYMSVHTPEICYSGAGYEMAGAPVPWSLEKTAAADSFWTAQFHKHGSLSGQLRLFWGWNAHGRWQALRQPRFETQGEPFLYKMYVSYEATTADTHLGEEFFRDFLPSLQQALFPSDK